jgi:hypothetical protein
MPPDIGIAPAAKMPTLPPAMAQKAERLPDMTDPSLGGIHKSGIDSDTAYNALALRYNALVDAWGCVKKVLMLVTRSRPSNVLAKQASKPSYCG